MVHHGRGLRRQLRDDELFARIAADWRSAGLSEQRLAMLRFVEKLTLTPARMVEANVAQLRDAGFTDRDVLDIVEVAGYYAYVNRIADGLGVEVEESVEED